MAEIAVAARIDEHSIHLAGLEHGDDPLFLVQIVVGRGKKRGIAPLGQGELYGLGHLGQGRIGDVGQDQPDRHRLPADQGLGDLIGHVIEIARRIANAQSRVLGDTGRAAQGQADRVHGEARPVGNILQSNNGPAQAGSPPIILP
jgi:hypothetical protein